ncbi:MAG TPA: hypothetical protein VMR45_05760 [Patescibacteria group bacterium]|nr:hypothetical protein [Patescibacteria group bacterium]
MGSIGEAAGVVNEAVLGIEYDTLGDRASVARDAFGLIEAVAMYFGASETYAACCVDFSAGKIPGYASQIAAVLGGGGPASQEIIGLASTVATEAAVAGIRAETVRRLTAELLETLESLRYSTGAAAEAELGLRTKAAAYLGAVGIQPEFTVPG